jgi:hypothetical protein
LHVTTALEGFLSSFIKAYPAPFAWAGIALKAVSRSGYEALGGGRSDMVLVVVVVLLHEMD